MISSARCAVTVFAVSLLAAAGSAAADEGLFFQAIDTPPADPASVTRSGELVPRFTDVTADALMVPFFRIDRGTPGGETTLIAIRNASDQAHDVTISYWVDHVFDPLAEPDLIQDFSLVSDEVVPINLRDLPELDGGGDNDDIIKGWLMVEHEDGVGDPLSADWFQVDTTQNFATGGRMVDIDHTSTCSQWDFRYITGGGFDGGTELRVFIDTPLGLGTPSFSVSFFSEAGAFLGGVSAVTNRQVADINVETELFPMLPAPPPDSGSMVITFSGGTNGGIVLGTYSAEERYSVGLNGTCLVP
ncbi:MAG TPA: hypothetical protein VF150_09090 [Thermoanaerobaculia bacterium]